MLSGIGDEVAFEQRLAETIAWCARVRIRRSRRAPVPPGLDRTSGRAAALRALLAERAMRLTRPDLPPVTDRAPCRRACSPTSLTNRCGTEPRKPSRAASSTRGRAAVGDRVALFREERRWDVIVSRVPAAVRSASRPTAMAVTRLNCIRWLSRHGRFRSRPTFAAARAASRSGGNRVPKGHVRCEAPSRNGERLTWSGGPANGAARHWLKPWSLERRRSDGEFGRSITVPALPVTSAGRDGVPGHGRPRGCDTRGAADGRPAISTPAWCVLKANLLKAAEQQVGDPSRRHRVRSAIARRRERRRRTAGSQLRRRQEPA